MSNSLVSIRGLCAKIRKRAKVKIRGKVEIPYGDDLKEIGGLRGYNGYRCFIGLFIDDEHYTPKIEGLSVDSLFAMGKFGRIPESRLPLLRRAQIIHDYVPLDKWDSSIDALEKDAMWQERYLAQEFKNDDVQATFARNVARAKGNRTPKKKEICNV